MNGGKRERKADESSEEGTRKKKKNLVAALPNIPNDVYFPFWIHISSAPLIHFRCTLILEPIYLITLFVYASSSSLTV